MVYIVCIKRSEFSAITCNAGDSGRAQAGARGIARTHARTHPLRAETEHIQCNQQLSRRLILFHNADVRARTRALSPPPHGTRHITLQSRHQLRRAAAHTPRHTPHHASIASPAAARGSPHPTAHATSRFKRVTSCGARQPTRQRRAPHSCNQHLECRHGIREVHSNPDRGRVRHGAAGIRSRADPRGHATHRSARARQCRGRGPPLQPPAPRNGVTRGAPPQRRRASSSEQPTAHTHR